MATNVNGPPMRFNARKDDKAQGTLQAQLKAEAAKPGNRTCAECKGQAPMWAAFNHGIFVCMLCAGFHRQLGCDVSRVKSMSLDDWTQEQVDVMRKIGNERSNAMYEARLPQGYVRTDMEDFIRRKYKRKEWYQSDPVRPASPRAPLGNQPSTPITNWNAPVRGGQKDYTGLLEQLHTMGFTDNAANQKALKKAEGNLDAALEELLSRQSEPDTPQMGPQAAHEYTQVQSQLAQLKAMGFQDEVQCHIAIRQSQGDQQAAIDYLLSSSKPMAGPAAAAQPLAAVDNLPPPKGSQTEPIAHKSSEILLLDDVFGPSMPHQETPMPNMESTSLEMAWQSSDIAKPQEQPISNTSQMSKNDILNLFNAQPMGFPQNLPGQAAYAQPGNGYMMMPAQYGQTGQPINYYQQEPMAAGWQMAQQPMNGFSQNNQPTSQGGFVGQEAPQTDNGTNPFLQDQWRRGF